MNSLVIKVLLFLSLVTAYPINSQSALGQDIRSLVIQLSDIGSDALLFREDVTRGDSNSSCNGFLQLFFIFYNDIFIEFMREHRVNRFRNITSEHIDSLRAQFDLIRQTWNSCVLHSKEISDPSQLAYRISEDNINFAVNRLREHGITEEALDVLKQIFELQQIILSSDNVRCQQEVNESYTDMAGRYNLISILLINRGQRSRVIEERARAEFDAVKAGWEACIKN